jgi:chromosome segregation ATPase
MRSSAFLEAQKNSLDGSLAFRKLIRTNLRRTQRDLQLAGREDVDALAAAIRRSQRRVLDQLEENAERLQSLEAKLDRLGQQMERIVGAQHGAENGAADASADAAGKHNGGKKKKRHKDKDRPATAGS